MPKARIALMGAGLIGREHVALVEANPEAALVGIADVSDEAAAFARGRGVPFFRDIEVLLDDTQPDGVIVALPNRLHLEAGLACVTRGIPVLVEKPIADTVGAALALVEAGERAGVPLLVGHHRRHSPDMQAARDAIARGDLGDVLVMNGLCLVRKHESYFATTWRQAPGGGPLLINAIHDIDCFRFLCGEITEVHAVASSRARGLPVEDTVAMSLRFAGGALGTFLLSDAVPSPYFWDTGSGQALYFPVLPHVSYVVGGTRGTLDIPTLDLWAHSDGGDWRYPLTATRMAAPQASCYARQLENLLGVIAGTAEPVVTARDATLTLAVTLAAARSAREGRAVEVAELLAEDAREG